MARVDWDIRSRWRLYMGPASQVAAMSGAPTDADYLVGTSQPGLSAEIVVGTTPGGELGGTWSSPTVDATHSGSTHAAAQAAAEATAAIALADHVADASEQVVDSGRVGVRRHFGGVLRNADDGLGWLVHDNDTHAHHGMGTPEVIVPGTITDRDHGYLRVPLLPVGWVEGDTVTGYGAVVPDETMAGNGVFVGVSGSYDELRVYFWVAHVDAGVYSIVAIGPNNPLVKGPTTNLWVTWDQFVDPAVGAPEDGDWTGYQLTDEKGAAGGYASLDAGALVPVTQLGTGTHDGTTFLRSDQTWQSLPSLALLQIVQSTADVTRNSTVLSNITGLSFPVVSGHMYWVDFQIRYDVTTYSTQGLLLGYTGPTGTGRFTCEIFGSGVTVVHAIADSTGVGTSDTDSAAVRNARICGTFRASANGTLQFMYARGGSSSAPGTTVYSGSGGLVWSV